MRRPNRSVWMGGLVGFLMCLGLAKGAFGPGEVRIPDFIADGQLLAKGSNNSADREAVVLYLPMEVSEVERRMTAFTKGDQRWAAKPLEGNVHYSGRGSNGIYIGLFPGKRVIAPGEWAEVTEKVTSPKGTTVRISRFEVRSMWSQRLLTFR